MSFPEMGDIKAAFAAACVRQPPEPDLDLAVFETDNLAPYLDTIDAAIFLLSQSPIARQLAETAIAADYTIIVQHAKPDQPLTQYGYVDADNKLIFVYPVEDARVLALVLAHELTHVSQIVRGGLDLNVLDEHPLSTIRRITAMEADARVHELGVALELDRAGIAGMLADAVTKSNSPYVNDVVRNMPATATPAELMADAFLTLYRMADLRASYEESVIAALEGAADDLIRDQIYLSAETPVAKVVDRLNSHAHAPYLADRGIEAALDSMLCRAIDAENINRIEAIAERSGRDRHAFTGGIPVYKAVPKNAPKPGV